MTLPGVTSIISDRRSGRFAVPSIGNWFVAGYAERGATDEPTLITSPSQKVLLTGDRTADTAMFHDSIEAFFRIGGRNVYFARIVGPDAEVAINTLNDATPEAALAVSAASPGEWGNDIDVVATKSGSTFTLRVDYKDNPVEQSPALSSNAEAVAWAVANSSYITLSDEGGDIPETATIALAGGDADLTSVTEAEVEAALSQFALPYGPGQVSAPGMASEAVHEALMAHAEGHKRVALLDAADSANVSTLIGEAIARRTEPGARFSGAFWPWAIIPGLAIGTTRTVPYSAIQAGLTARAAGEGRAPGDPIAGELGATDYPLGLSQDALTDADREAMNDAGINVAITYGDEVRTYGNRTLANPLTDANWSQLSQSRTVMAVVAIAEEVGQSFFQRKIDGRGFTLADYGRELEGRACMPFYLNNDLYGENPEDAFSVNVGPEVNPAADVAAGKLLAAISLRTSPGGDMITIEVVKVPTGESL